MRSIRNNNQPDRTFLKEGGTSNESAYRQYSCEYLADDVLPNAGLPGGHDGRGVKLSLLALRYRIGQ